MEKITFKSVLLIAGLTVGSLSLSATPLFSEDFTGLTVGDNLAGQSDWVAAGSGTVNPIIANTSLLTYTNYKGGGGNYISFPKGSSTSNRVYKSFTQKTLAGDSVYYVSLLLNIASTTEVSTNDSYFTGITNNGGTTYYDRLIVKQSGSGYAIGVSKNAGNFAYASTPTECTFGQTYLIVLRHTVVSGSGNDVVELWINPDISTEPLTTNAEVSTSTGNDPTAISDFIWQNASTRGPAGSIDGIRIGFGETSALAWANLDAYDPGTKAKKASTADFSVISGKGQLTINLPEAAPIQVINAQGTIQTIKGNAGANTVSLPQGYYIVKVKDSSTVNAIVH